MNQLLDAYEQMTKMNTEIMDYWRKAVSDMPWPGPGFAMGENVNPWMEMMRSGYQMSVSSWNQMMDQSLEMLLKSLKETRSYRQAMEKQIRQNWEELKSVQQNQEQKTREFFGNLANFLKEGASHPQA